MNHAHRLLVSAIAIGSIATIAGAQEMKKEIGAGEGQVNIVAWPGYIERGETDKNYDWVTDFEKATGCKVNIKTAGTSDEMVALMNEGGFDLVTASGDASLRLISGKRVQPINIDLIPVLEERSTSGCRMRRGTRSTASITAFPISGVPMCSPTTPTCSRKRRRAGRSCSRSRTCRTASRTRAASRRSTARSISPMPRST